MLNGPWKGLRKGFAIIYCATSVNRHSVSLSDCLIDSNNFAIFFPLPVPVKPQTNTRNRSPFYGGPAPQRRLAGTGRIYEKSPALHHMQAGKGRHLLLRLGVLTANTILGCGLRLAVFTCPHWLSVTLIDV